MYYLNEECKPCLPTFYSDIRGARSCLKCPPGSVSEKYGSVACTKCPKGTYANVRCVKCDPGYFSDIIGAGTCRKCPVGTYSEIFGGDTCKKCPKGTTTVVSGSKYIDDCGADLNGKIKSTFDEFKKGISDWQVKTDAKIQENSEQIVRNHNLIGTSV